MSQTRLNFTLNCSPCKRTGKTTPLNIYAADVKDGKLVLSMTCPVCGETDTATVEFGPIKAGQPESAYSIPAPCHCGGRRAFVRANTLGSVDGQDTATASTICTSCQTLGTAEITVNTAPRRGRPAKWPALKDPNDWTFRPGISYQDALQLVYETPGLRRLPAQQLEAVADLLVLNAPARPQIKVRRGDWQALGAAFRELRLRRKAMIKDVAAATGFSSPSITLAERPRHDISLNVITALADFYGVEVVITPNKEA